jgi:hypothetical protein
VGAFFIMSKNIRHTLIRVGIGALAVLFLLAFMTLAGCNTTPAPIKVPGVEGVGDDIKARAKAQINATEQIDSQAQAASDRAPEEAAAIAAKSQEIRDDAHAIHAAAGSLRAAQTEIDRLARENSSLKSDRDRLQNRVLGLSAVVCVIGLGVTVALFLFGKLPNLTLSGIFACTLASILVFDWLLAYAWWIGALSVGAAVAYFVYLVWVKNKSLREVMQTVDEARKEGAIVWDKFTPIANRVQDRVTRAVIDAEQYAKKRTGAKA